MLAETVSLGVLSIPAVFAAIGFVGGVLTVLCLGVFATCAWSGSRALADTQRHRFAVSGPVLL